MNAHYRLPRSDEEHLRASDADRDLAVAALQQHYMEGRLTVREFDDRLAKAYASTTLGDLAALLRDLPVEAARRRRRSASASRQPSAEEQALRPHLQPKTIGGLAIYVSVMLLLVGIWVATGTGYWWWIWPMFAWGLHAISQVMRDLGLPVPVHTCSSHRRGGGRRRHTGDVS